MVDIKFWQSKGRRRADLKVIDEVVGKADAGTKSKIKVEYPVL